MSLDQQLINSVALHMAESHIHNVSLHSYGFVLYYEGGDKADKMIQNAEQGSCVNLLSFAKLILLLALMSF